MMSISRVEGFRLVYIDSLERFCVVKGSDIVLLLLLSDSLRLLPTVSHNITFCIPDESAQ